MSVMTAIAGKARTGLSVGRLATVVAAFGIASYGLTFLLWTRFHWGGEGRVGEISDLAILPVDVAAAVFAWWAARRLPTGGRKRAWRWVALAFTFWAAADIYWAIEDLALQSTPNPSWADAGYLAFYPSLMCALTYFPMTSLRRADVVKLVLDVGVVIIAAAMATWFLVIGPTTHNHPFNLALGVATSYPVGDLALIFSLTYILLRRPVPTDRRSLQLLLPGVALFVVADVWSARVNLDNGYRAGTWVDALYMLAQCLFALGALAQLSHRPKAPEAVRQIEDSRLRVSALPFLATAGGLALMGSVAIERAKYPLGGLVIGTICLAAVAMVRQFVALRDNQRFLLLSEHQARTDFLTGLLNRRKFLELGDTAMAQSQFSGEPVSMLMIDVDHFKTINDTHSHAVGDIALQTVALSCVQYLRRTDVIGRYGGDEIVAVLPSTDAATAVAVAGRLQQYLRNHPLETPEETVPITLSIGVATASATTSLKQLLETADRALYQAKRDGRDCTRSVSL